MTAKARGSDSTRTAEEAPRDRASKASAPVPANRSSTRAPPALSPSISNIASLTRSAVGLTARPPGVRIRLPRHTPATMRTAGSQEKGKPDRSGVRKNRENEDFRHHRRAPPAGVPAVPACVKTTTALCFRSVMIPGKTEGKGMGHPIPTTLRGDSARNPSRPSAGQAGLSGEIRAAAFPGANLKKRRPLHPVPSTGWCLPIIGISLFLVKDPHSRHPPSAILSPGRRGTLSAGKSGKGSQ